MQKIFNFGEVCNLSPWAFWYPIQKIIDKFNTMKIFFLYFLIRVLWFQFWCLVFGGFFFGCTTQRMGSWSPTRIGTHTSCITRVRSCTGSPGKSVMFRFLILWINFCIWYNLRAQMRCLACGYPVFLAPFVEEFNYPSLFWFTFSQNIFFSSLHYAGP